MERAVKNLDIVHQQGQTEGKDTQLYEFLRKEIINADGVLIPFHAIDHVDVTIGTETVERPDPICGASGNALQDENGTDLEDENGAVIEGD